MNRTISTLVAFATVVACGTSSSTPPPLSSSSSSSSTSSSSSSGSSTSSTSSSGTSSSGSSSTEPNCNLPFFPDDYPSSCQTALDAVCCDQEKACGASADCAKLVDCIDACPKPRTDACINECTGDASQPPGFDLLDAISTCSKGKLDAGTECNWPR